MKYTIILILCFLSLICSAQSVFKNDIWSHWGDSTGVNYPVVGVNPANFSTYKNVVTDLGFDNTGATDLTSALTSAIATYSGGFATPHVLYFPAGDYTFGSQVQNPGYSGVIIRGAGMGITRFHMINGGGAAFLFGQADSPDPQATTIITGGAIKDSSTITVANSSAIGTGEMFITSQNPNYVHTVFGGTNVLGLMVHVVSKTLTTISFFPPLVEDLPGTNYCSTYTTVETGGCGYESFSLDLANNYTVGIEGDHFIDCWIYNVEIFNSHARNVVLSRCMDFEVLSCYMHDNYTGGGGPDTEGLDVAYLCCYGRIQNNIFSAGGYPAIILGDASGKCVGNVIAYNYSCNEFEFFTSFSINHGPQNMFNLFEGNSGKDLASDGYFGGDNNNTIFRNYLNGVQDTNNYPGTYALQLNHWAYYDNVVGNVLGSNGFVATYTTTNNGSLSANAFIYLFGYPNPGNFSYSGVANYPGADCAILTCPLDTGVTNTLGLNGNFDFSTGTTIWDPNNTAPHILPSSLYITTLPWWWPAGVFFPPIGPDLSPMVSINPAEWRYHNMIYKFMVK